MNTEAKPCGPAGGRWRVITTMAAMLLASCGGGDRGSAPLDRESAQAAPSIEEEVDHDAPIDFGFGPGVPLRDREQRQAIGAAAVAPQSVAPANGGLEAHRQGAFGPAFPWPVIPIHMVLLPDGRIMAYGTDLLGRQGASLHYVVWDPALGSAPEAMLQLANTTRSDIFCAGQLLLPRTGDVLLLGGDEYAAGDPEFGIADMNVFNPASNVMTRQPQKMAFRRWYPTLVTTGGGEQVILGGRINIVRSNGQVFERNLASTPEVFSPDTGFRTLTAAQSDAAYGKDAESFYYPRAWLTAGGDVFILGFDGKMFRLDIAGNGTLHPLTIATSASNFRMPSTMFAPGKILSLRNNAQAVVVDINGPAPVVTPTAPLSAHRQWGSATVLADGQVWVNGGSQTHNSLRDAAYHSETWNPATGSWTRGASTTKARLYHSTSIMLTDGSVLTGGGGANGPVQQFNGEVYFPPYLFRKDGSGRFARRPLIASAPAQAAWNEAYAFRMSNDAAISRVTLVRTGSVTHSYNNEDRFFDLPFVQTGNGVRVTMPALRNVAPPGFYMLFAFNAYGVPSLAKVLQLL